MTAKIAIAGEKDVIFPFKAIGVETFGVSNIEEAKRVVEKLIKEEVGIIILPEDWIPHIRCSLNRTLTTPLPCILPIPGIRGSSELWSRELRELVKKAVGVDIMRTTDEHR